MTRRMLFGVAAVAPTVAVSDKPRRVRITALDYTRVMDALHSITREESATLRWEVAILRDHHPAGVYFRDKAVKRQKEHEKRMERELCRIRDKYGMADDKNAYIWWETGDIFWLVRSI